METPEQSESRAAEQVGKSLANTGRAWVLVSPLHHGSTLRTLRGR